MIQPNFNLMLWIILIVWVFEGIFKIIAGCLEWEKRKKYDVYDVVDGVIMILVVLLALLTGSGV